MKWLLCPMVPSPKEMMNIATYYKCNHICHRCRVTKTNYMKAPSTVAADFQHSAETFLSESIKPGPSPFGFISTICVYLFYFGLILEAIFFFSTCLIQQWGPLTNLPMFTHDMLKFCTMHVCNLGCDLWILGSAFKLLLEHPSADIWHGSNENDRLAGAYSDFKAWTRRHKMTYLVADFNIFLLMGCYPRIADICNQPIPAPAKACPTEVHSC